jgi:hypothetical protein
MNLHFGDKQYKIFTANFSSRRGEPVPKARAGVVPSILRFFSINIWILRVLATKKSNFPFSTFLEYFPRLENQPY